MYGSAGALAASGGATASCISPYKVDVQIFSPIQSCDEGLNLSRKRFKIVAPKEEVWKLTGLGCPHLPARIVTVRLAPLKHAPKPQPAINWAR